jgi:hypothetical protein
VTAPHSERGAQEACTSPPPRPTSSSRPPRVTAPDSERSARGACTSPPPRPTASCRPSRVMDEWGKKVYSDIMKERGKEFDKRRELLKICSDIIEENDEIWRERKEKCRKRKGKSKTFYGKTSDYGELVT